MKYMSARNGIVLINKPRDWTSFDVIAKLRGILGTKKIGHTGTLDPIATGVLIVCVGKAAKLSDYFMHKKKTYIAEMEFGKTSNTQDITGEITDICEPKIAKKQLDEIVKKFVGDIKQTPPMFSAIKVGGRKLYDLAREGIEIERDPRRVSVYDIKILEHTDSAAKIEVECSAGTYIRTLVHDIGSALGCGAVMTSLVRTKNGKFELKDCVSIEKAEIKPIILEEICEIPFPTSLCIGKFDGVHNGHKAVIEEVIKSEFLPAALIIDNKEEKILDEQKRQEKLHKLGIDAMIYQNIDGIKDIEYQEFFEEFIYKKLHAREITVGFDFFFGKNREGDIEKLQELCKKFCVKLNVISPVFSDGKPISSSDLRKMSKDDETFVENIVKNY
ncbi:tRNA pseudouridine(55) synthase TruB [Treponema sp. R6D11]